MKFLLIVLITSCVLAKSYAMPTKVELDAAAPRVKERLKAEWKALNDGKKTRAEVADAAMKLAGEADTDAAKFLLMKGAFALYVKEGDLEKAVGTMRTLETAIADLSPQNITNIVKTALLGLPVGKDGAVLYRLLEKTQAPALPQKAHEVKPPPPPKRDTIASILKGMIKVPGRDYWLSETELTQGQWEAVMGNNPSKHRGENLPADSISRDDCERFIEKLNETPEVKASEWEFGLPTLDEWGYALKSGGTGNDCWIEQGVVGNILDMAWTAENSSNQTHEVATKKPNAFGLYDMFGNVWEWMNCEDKTVGCRHGCSFSDPMSECKLKTGFHTRRSLRSNNFGMRLAAHHRAVDGKDHEPRRQLLTAPSSKPNVPINKEPQPEPEQCDLQF